MPLFPINLRGDVHADVRRPYLWLLGIIALGAALRLYRLGSTSLWYDEAAVIYLTKYWSNPAKFLNPEFCNDPPLHTISTSLWYKGVLLLPGVEQGSVLFDWLLRLYPATVGILSIAAIFFTGRKLLGLNRPALFAAFLFAVSPFQIYYAQDLRAYALHVLLNIVAVYLLLQTIDKNRLRDWVALTFVLAAGVYNHFFMVWCIVAINLYFALMLPRYWPLLGRWIVCNLAVIILVLPPLYMAMYMSYVFGTASETWYPFPGLKTGLITFKNFFAGYSNSPEAYRALTVLAAVLVGIGVLSLRRRVGALVLLLVLGFGTIAISIAYWRTQHFPYYTHRLLIFSAIPAYYLVGQGMAALPARAIRFAVAGVFALLTLPALVDYYQQNLHPLETHTAGILYKSDNRKAAAFIEANLKQGDEVVHRIRKSYLPFLYYLEAEQKVVELTERGIRAAMIGYPSIEGYENFGTRPVLLQEVLPRAERLWLVNTWWRPYDREVGTEALRSWLDHHYVRDLWMPFDGLGVYRYKLQFPTAPGMQVMQLADEGADHILYYEGNGGGGAIEDFDASWRALLSQKRDFLLHADLPPAVFAPREEIGDLSQTGVVNSFCKVSGNEVGYRFRLVNPFPFALEVELTVNRTSETIPAMAMSSDVLSGDWIPAYLENAAVEKPASHYLVLAATLEQTDARTTPAYTELLLAPGEYSLWVRCATNAPSIDGRLTAAAVSYEPAKSDDVLTHSVTPTLTNGRSGMQWHRVGNVIADHRPARVAITAENPGGLDFLRFELDRIAFVPANAAAEYAKPQRQRVTLDAGSSKVITGISEFQGDERMRIDVQAYTPALGQYRRINFYVHQSGD